MRQGRPALVGLCCFVVATKGRVQPISDWLIELDSSRIALQRPRQDIAFSKNLSSPSSFGRSGRARRFSV
jgi:hypothetical protein